MDIDLLPMGESVLVDANIFIYHLGGLSAQCRNFLLRVARGEVTASITTIIIAEILHRRMIAEAISKNLITAGQPLKKLKANPTIISLLSDYIADMRALLTLPMQIVEVTNSDIAASHALRQTHGLFVNDSITLACSMRLGIRNIVTHDADFSRVSAVTVWEPPDV